MQIIVSGLPAGFHYRPGCCTKDSHLPADACLINSPDDPRLLSPPFTAYGRSFLNYIDLAFVTSCAEAEETAEPTSGER